MIKKLWDEHLITALGDGSSVIYIARVFLHERTGSAALKGLEAAQRPVRNPEQTFCTLEHAA